MTFWWRTIAFLAARHFSKQQRSIIPRHISFERFVIAKEYISKNHDCVCRHTTEQLFYLGSEWKSDIVTEKIEQNPHQKQKYSLERYGLLSVRIVVLDARRQIEFRFLPNLCEIPLCCWHAVYFKWKKTQTLINHN